MAFILTIFAVAIILIGNEFWYRKRAPHDEFSRKFVHITVGTFVAFWPFYLDWLQIQILSIGFLIMVTISKLLGLFQAIHSVQRPTWGEVCFAASVGLVSLITHNKWIYAAALLQMSIADGMAAVVGTKYSGKYKYSIYGHAKSLAGTLTFFVFSVAILAGLNSQLPTQLSIAEILGIGALASLFENIFLLGLDNLFVPFIVALILVNI